MVNIAAIAAAASATHSKSGVSHCRYGKFVKGKREIVCHSHPRGHISHSHSGMAGYGRTKGSLRR